MSQAQKHTDKADRRGLMIVLSSPSGAGKSTLTRALLAEDSRMSMSVSATTRRPRDSEIDGKDYYFLSLQKFDTMREDGEFLEHAKVFDNYYGTPRRPVEDALSHGLDVVFDIDWQGAQQLTQAAADDIVKIFILPPSTRELEKRLRSRAQDSAEVIAKRMAKSAAEISHWPEYDYVVVNEDLGEALREIKTIIAAERLRRRRQVWLGPFVRDLLNNID